MTYETTFNQPPIDVSYDTSRDILIYGFSNQIIFYQLYQSSINNNILPNQLTLNQIQFYRFLLNDVYLTYDKKIIHCNIQSATIINIIQLDIQIFITNFASNRSKSTLFVGFSNGQMLQYNLKDKSCKYYNLSTDTSAINISVIKLIVNEQNQSQPQVLYVTNGGLLIIIDSNKQQIIQQINLIQLVNEEININLQNFIFDQIYSKYIFFFSGQKRVYVWNIDTKQQEIFLMLPNDQGNQIKLTDSFILTSCSYQINVYTRSQTIQLLTIIKKNNFQDFILDYHAINDNQIVLLLQNRYELYLLQGNTFQLISQQSYQYPRFLGYIYNQEQNIIKLYILHQSGLQFTIS
ncbi:hypothetical protein TTHERM_000760211 (macronuclear) [Tetrahymena thermophila SB210]|uniref:Uncharacterized protein n=1 Tax=Tetrahymena thermophila (strain SB210) TaxID=312017 RepID=W7X5V0_TETTS|nr:hypothetical protein TTHERM_000760211 [Tetrahymena thermophila SB210]EWS71733.1 hypothetical protein TTHERM_000760211 [Tetrahymena thermophila SB210]|eukprot:XP_012655719.1 hypothetical protein TTHERM_000760211 [Tetrahymena thermophila SB210]